MFLIQNSKTPVLTFLCNVLPLNFYFLLPLLKIIILSFITSWIFLLLTPSTSCLTTSIDEYLELHLFVRPYAKHTFQIPSINNTSDLSLQTIPSSPNVLLVSSKFRSPYSSFSPEPTNTQPSTSYSLHHCITSSKIKFITTQPSLTSIKSFFHFMFISIIPSPLNPNPTRLIQTFLQLFRLVIKILNPLLPHLKILQILLLHPMILTHHYT